MIFGCFPRSSWVSIPHSTDCFNSMDFSIHRSTYSSKSSKTLPFISDAYGSAKILIPTDRLFGSTANKMAFWYSLGTGENEGTIRTKRNVRENQMKCTCVHFDGIWKHFGWNSDNRPTYVIRCCKLYRSKSIELVDNVSEVKWITFLEHFLYFLGMYSLNYVAQWWNWHQNKNLLWAQINDIRITLHFMLCLNAYKNPSKCLHREIVLYQILTFLGAVTFLFVVVIINTQWL